MGVSIRKEGRSGIGAEDLLETRDLVVKFGGLLEIAHEDVGVGQATWRHCRFGIAFRLLVHDDLPLTSGLALCCVSTAGKASLMRSSHAGRDDWLFRAGNDALRPKDHE